MWEWHFNKNNNRYLICKNREFLYFLLFGRLQGQNLVLANTTWFCTFWPWHHRINTVVYETKVFTVIVYTGVINNLKNSHEFGTIVKRWDNLLGIFKFSEYLIIPMKLYETLTGLLIQYILKLNKLLNFTKQMLHLWRKKYSKIQQDRLEGIVW